MKKLQRRCVFEVEVKKEEWTKHEYHKQLYHVLALPTLINDFLPIIFRQVVFWCINRKRLLFNENNLRAMRKARNVYEIFPPFFAKASSTIRLLWKCSGICITIFHLSWNEKYIKQQLCDETCTCNGKLLCFGWRGLMKNSSLLFFC